MDSQGRINIPGVFYPTLFPLGPFPKKRLEEGEGEGNWMAERGEEGVRTHGISPFLQDFVYRGHCPRRRREREVDGGKREGLDCLRHGWE